MQSPSCAMAGLIRAPEWPELLPKARSPALRRQSARLAQLTAGAEQLPLGSGALKWLVGFEIGRGSGTPWPTTMQRPDVRFVPRGRGLKHVDRQVRRRRREERLRIPDYAAIGGLPSRLSWMTSSASATLPSIR